MATHLNMQWSCGIATNVFWKDCNEPRTPWRAITMPGIIEFKGNVKASRTIWVKLKKHALLQQQISNR
jgi:hypothetical protein